MAKPTLKQANQIGQIIADSNVDRYKLQVLINSGVISSILERWTWNDIDLDGTTSITPNHEVRTLGENVRKIMGLPPSKGDYKVYLDIEIPSDKPKPPALDVLEYYISGGRTFSGRTVDFLSFYPDGIELHWGEKVSKELLLLDLSKEVPKITDLDHVLGAISKKGEVPGKIEDLLLLADEYSTLMYSFVIVAPGSPFDLKGFNPDLNSDETKTMVPVIGSRGSHRYLSWRNTKELKSSWRYIAI